MTALGLAHSENAMDLDELFAIAADIGVAVRWCDLGTRKGGFDRRAQTIYLSTRLTRTQARCTLAHELGHAHFGDLGPCSDAQEERAWRWAAELLIDPVDYRKAEEIYDGRPAAIAKELDVTLDLLRGWRGYLRSHESGRVS